MTTKAFALNRSAAVIASKDMLVIRGEGGSITMSGDEVLNTLNAAIKYATDGLDEPAQQREHEHVPHVDLARHVLAEHGGNPPSLAATNSLLDRLLFIVESGDSGACIVDMYDGRQLKVSVA